VSSAKAVLKRGLVQALARAAPLTWRWRPPGSLVVLMYHRVLPQSAPARRTEQPGMYVSPETFDLHLRELGRYFELVHLDDWLRRAGEGRSLPHRSCAITFDDGWRDNLEFALPVLTKYGAPATIFLVSSYIGSTYRFWPNRLLSLMARCFAARDSGLFPEPLRGLVEPVLESAAKRGELTPEDADRAVMAAKDLDEPLIRELIGAAEAGSDEPQVARDILSGEEIAQLAATGLVRFGSHTATHYRLRSPVAAEDLQREIVFSQCELQRICGQPIELFCYPNGDTSPEAIELTRRHYLGAVTTRQGWHAASEDPYLIRRIGVHEDISNTPEAFLARVSSWV
jgi:peptidoglycan/xylan/chitin deacetylase (PgdA/CDA1 family)